MLDLIERLLLEADLENEIPKLDVYGKTIDGIKDLLKYLLLDPNTGIKYLHQKWFNAKGRLIPTILKRA